jgi:hypothetical protein
MKGDGKRVGSTGSGEATTLPGMEGRVNELNILPLEEELSGLSVAEMMFLPPGWIITGSYLKSYFLFLPIDFIQ